MPEKKRILIVDDDNDHCYLLSSMLSYLGFDNIVTARSGEDALGLLKESSFDLIIADMRMSGISGIELLKRIKSSTPNLPFIICTAYGEMDSYLEAMDLGAFDYLNKPVKKDELKKVIHKALTTP